MRMVSSAIPIITFRYYPYKQKKLTFWVSLLCAVENRGILPFVLGILIAVVRKPGKVRVCEEKRCVVANVKVVVCVCGGARGI